MKEVKVIGIAGGSGSGKSTVVRKIGEVCKSFVSIAQDSYYKSASYVNNANITAFNFDHPDAFDNELLCEHIRMLKAGKPIDMPQYDFVHHCRREETIHIEPAPLVIIDGLMIFYEPEIRELLDLKIYVDTPHDIRFIRRLQRDILERGRTLESVVKQVHGGRPPRTLLVHRANQGVCRPHSSRGRSQREGHEGPQFVRA